MAWITMRESGFWVTETVVVLPDEMEKDLLSALP
jgi:hypothetical protein